jgi:hypothetical protein
MPDEERETFLRSMRSQALGCPWLLRMRPGADAVRSWCFVVDQLGMAPHKINGTDRVPDIGGLSC